ncbi:MAG TPA: amidase [Beutenbergiaceae bacterium]|nr:amidase [Beutenbergiaceae bacterium]
MSALDDLSAVELAAAIAAREVGCVEVTRQALQRAEERNAQLGAFITITPELALSQAEQAQQMLAESDPADLPPLLGVPLPIKDLNQVAGVPMTAGSAALRDVVPDADDGVVTLLRQAGTTMIGKTNTPEFGFPCYTEPDIAPPARNPWDLSRTAGGSSGGAAAAVAGGITPIAHGSDGGGSIRIPAAACGLVGLKPARGRISPGPNGLDGPGLSTNGVLTRTVADTALALDILARPWPGDTYSAPPPATTFTEAARRSASPLRIGVLTEPTIAPDVEVHPQALAAVDKAVGLLSDMGHHLDTAPVPFSAEDWEPFRPMWAVMASSIPLPPEADAAMRPLTRWLREAGREVSGLAYANAVSGGQRLTRQAAHRWADFDLILTPSLAMPPPAIGAIRNDADPAADFQAQMEFTPWTSSLNIIGKAAISLPLHHAKPDDDAPELPFGVTLASVPAGGEDVLLSLAADLERAAPWAHRRPGPMP